MRQGNITITTDDSQSAAINLTVNVTFEVKYANFSNNLTTSFSSFNEMQLANLSNATIGVSNKGLINFSGQTIDFRGSDLDNYINVSDNLISINTTALSNLNMSAILTLYNLSFNNPRILRDGTICGINVCDKISYSSGTLLFNVTSFSNYSSEDYCGNNFCESAEETCTSCSADCGTCPSSEIISGGGGGGGGIAQEKKPEKKAFGAEFSSIPVILEVPSGEASVFGVSIRSKLEKKANVYINTRGIPIEWVSFKPKTLSLEAGSEGSVTIVINVPEDVKAGDREVVIVASGDGINIEDFFILRIRSIHEEYDKPIITRFVEIDAENKKTNIKIEVSNQQERDYPLVEVVEDVPKTMASHAKEIEFLTEPSEIVRADPVIQWNILNLRSGEKRNISYAINKILPEFTPYIYWPLQQVNILIQKIPSKFKLGFKIPTLAPGKISMISLDVENSDNASHKFKFFMELPPEWKLNPEQIEETINANEKKEWKISLSVPKGAESGTYVVRAVFDWDGDSIIKEYPVIIQSYFIVLIYAVSIIIALSLVAFIVSRLVRLKKPPYERMNILGRIREQVRR